MRIHLGDQLAHAGHRIQNDSTLQRGDCQIEAGNTRVDATLENRWQRVVASLGGTLQLNAPEEESGEE
jgi:flagellar assembly protein FliH